jgi:hypothetical protein
MDVWKADPFGSLPNSKATATGLAWNKSLRSVDAGNRRASGVRRFATGLPVCPASVAIPGGLLTLKRAMPFK